MNASEKSVLDACCGSRMMWFNPQHPATLFVDNRSENAQLCDGRILSVKPDIVADFRCLPFENERFFLVVFDPPHLLRAGARSWLSLKYGRLNKSTWQDDIRQGFTECWRVLKPYGTLIFKWSEVQITLNNVLPLMPAEPLFGFRRGRSIFVVLHKAPGLNS